MKKRREDGNGIFDLSIRFRFRRFGESAEDAESGMREERESEESRENTEVKMKLGTLQGNKK